MNTPKNQPNNDNTGNSSSAHQGRTAFSTGTTTQGGSNFGQGSSQLGGQAYQQGGTASTGASYDNEAGKLGTGQPTSGTQQGGGAGGYDVNREQEEINKEREDMNSERDLDQVDVERPNLTPDEHEGPGKEPGNPGVR